MPRNYREPHYPRRVQRIEEQSYHASDRRWKMGEVLGLWAAAIVGLIAVVVASCDARQERDVMRGQLDDLTAERRPWVYPSILINAPLTWTSENDAQIRFDLIITNTGNSPAADIVTKITIRTLRDDHENNIFDNRGTEKEMCQSASQRADIGSQTLFPNEVKHEQFGANSDHDELAHAWPNAENVSFKIVGCIDYRFAALPENHGQTGFVYDISRFADKRTHRTGLKPGETIAPDDIAVDSNVVDGIYLK